MLAGAADEITAEFGGDRDCIARLAAHYRGNYVGALTHMAGADADAAAKWIEHGLIEDLDDQRG